MASFLRDSKFKSLTITAAPKEACYEQLRTVTSTTSDGNNLTANSKYLAYVDSAGGGSAIGVLPLSSVGKNHVPITSTAYQQPLIRAHGGCTSDLAFNPFDESQLASCCATDRSVKLWNVPAGGFIRDCSEPAAAVQLSASMGPPLGVTYHPAVAGLLAVRSGKEVGLVDVAAGGGPQQLASAVAGTAFGAATGSDLTSLAFSLSTSGLMAVTSKDKHLYLLDTRADFGRPAAGKFEIHQGIRPSRVCWLGGAGAGSDCYLATTGHGRNNQDREVSVWDVRMMKGGAAALSTTRLDSSTGALMPFYCCDTGLLLLMGKGDANLRVFEAEGGTLHPLANTVPAGSNSSSDVTRGATLLPRQCLDQMSCEVLRALRLQEGQVQPLSFRVVRAEKSKHHADLYPPATTLAAPVHASVSAWQAAEVGLDLGCGTALNTVPLPVPKAASAASGVPSVSTSTADSGSPSPVTAGSSSSSSSRASSNRFSALGGIASKYKHMWGAEGSKADVYFNLQPVTTGVDGQVISCSDRYWAVPYVGGGGPVYVSKHGAFGKVEPGCHVVNGHKSSVLDTAFSPFDGSILATASDDCTVKLWRLQDDLLAQRSLTETDATATLCGSRHAVKSCQFHEVVPNLLCTSTADNCVRLYDVNDGCRGDPVHTISVGEGDSAVNNIMNVSFNWTGSLFAVACRDKTLHIKDPRAGSGGNVGQHCTSSVSSISSLGRNLRVAWCSNPRLGAGMGTLLTVSSSSMGMRQLQLFDPRMLSASTAPAEALCSRTVDNAAGQLYPMFDEDTNLVFLAGKGDTIVRCFELGFAEEGAGTGSPLPSAATGGCMINKCTEFQSSRAPFAGMCMLPKRMCDVAGIQVARMLKLTTDSVIPVGFTVPRADQLKQFFQDDLFPPSRSYDAAAVPTTAAEWLAGEHVDLLPVHSSLRPAGMEAASAANPTDLVSPAARNNRNSTTMRAELDKREEEAKKKDDVFNRLQQMAILRSTYHPNASGGSGGHGFKCDAAPAGKDDEDSDDGWND